MTPGKTADVLASARRGLQAQLAVVREEIGRLAVEERALTEAISSLDGGGGSAAAAPRAGRPSATPKRSGGRRRRTRGAVKSTPERVKELQALLADGPRTRNELAAALKVSPARVQQLLAELGGSVSSQPAPGQRQGKLWSLKGAGNGAPATTPTPKRSSASE